MDHLFIRSSEPEFLIYFASAYICCSKASLLQVSCVEDLSVFLQAHSTAQFKKIITEAETLHSQLKTTIFSGANGQYLPICQSLDGTSSAYKTFTRYPDHFVSFQNRLREKVVN